MTVADAFIKASTKRYLGDYFMSYCTKNIPKLIEKVDTKRSVAANLKGVKGGKEFVKELNSIIRPKTTYTSLDDNSTNMRVRLPRSDMGLVDVIDSHLKEPPLKISSYDKDTPKLFNCVSLSPLLASQLGSYTKQIPYKYRHATPHKGERRQESVPTYITVLQHHCQEKRNIQVQEMRKKQREAQRGPSKVHGDEDLRINVRDLGPNFKELFVKRYKMNPIDSLNNK